MPIFYNTDQDLLDAIERWRNLNSLISSKFDLEASELEVVVCSRYFAAEMLKRFENLSLESGVPGRISAACLLLNEAESTLGCPYYQERIREMRRGLDGLARRTAA